MHATRVLDLDLDYFLDAVEHWGGTSGRLSDDRFKPWPENDVRRLLEQTFGLSTGRKTPGRVVTHHHEALDFWDSMKSLGRMSFPFEVVHVDAHSDLGVGMNSTSHFVQFRLLHEPVQDRHAFATKHKAINAGNYLLIAVACRWITKLTYVPCDASCDVLGDLPPYAFEGMSVLSDALELKQCDPASFGNWANRRSGRFKVISKEPQVPFEMIPASHFSASSHFDFVVLSKSPSFTPPAADLLIPVIEDYLDPC